MLDSLKVKPEPTFSFKTVQTVSIHQMANLLCNALEGGSNYWMTVGKRTKPANFNNTKEGDEQFTHLSYPTNEGGSIVIIDHEDGDKKHTLTLKKLQKGMKVMAQKYPYHFNDFIKDNDDATTGDAFLQCSLFGEILYA